MLGDDSFDTKQFFRPLLPIGAEFCNYTNNVGGTVGLGWSMVSWLLKRDRIAKGLVAQPYP